MPGSLTEPRVDYVAIPPDGGWGWFVVLVAFCWNVIVDGTCFTFALFMSEMLQDFKVTHSLLMVSSSTQMGLYYFIGPLVAAMINRFGFRTVAMTGGLLAFGGVLSSAYVDNIYLFIFTFGCTLGVAFSMIYMCNILVVGFYFDKYRAVATCIAVSGSPMGVSVFPFILSILIPDMHWRDKYKYISGTHLLMTLFGLVYKSIPLSEVITDTRKGVTENSSIWDEWEREHPVRGVGDYPTNAEALENINYTIVTPYDILDQDSDQSGSIRTKMLSISTLNRYSSADIPKYIVRKICCCRCKCKYVPCACLWHDTRPMYRDDILYHGSTRKLRQYNRSEIDLTKRRTAYHMNVTRTSNFADTPENADCCNCCPDSVIRVLLTMLDFSLVKSFAFFLLAFSGFLTYLGLYIPYMHGIEFSVQNHVDKAHASYVLTAIGISNCVGRMVSGFVTTMIPKIRPIILSEITLVFAGTACIAHPYFSSFLAHIICASIFGFNIATISSMRTLVVVDLLGLEKLTNAFGLIVLLEGLSSLVAMPLNAFLYESYNDLKVPFVFSGIMIILSGIILIPVESLYKLEKKRKMKKEEHRRWVRSQQIKRLSTKSTHQPQQSTSKR